MISLDILICTMNSARTILECLTAIKYEFPSSRIILVDGGSSDDTLGLVETFDGIDIFIKPELSLAESRWFGIEASQSEFVFQIDSDVVLKKGAAQVILRSVQAAEKNIGAIEYGINDYMYSPFPTKEIIANGAYNKRAYFFATLIRSSLFDFPKISLRHLEEEYARRMLESSNIKWIKTGEIIGDHYSSPNRYGGSGLSNIVRVRPFPVWTFFDEGKLDAITKPSLSRVPMQCLKIVYRVLNIELFLIWIKSIGNPFFAVANYLVGFLRAR